MKISSKNLSERLPIGHFQSDYLVFTDGSLGAGFRVGGFDASVASVENFNQFAQGLENFLNTASEGLTIQVYFDLSHDVNRTLNEHEQLSNHGEKSYGKIARARFDHLRDKAKACHFFCGEIYVFVRSDALKYQKRKFWHHREQVFAQEFDQTVSGKIESFTRDVKHVISSLQEAGLTPEAITDNRWSKLLFDSLNPNRSDAIGYPAFRTSDLGLLPPKLLDQLLLSDIKVAEDHLRVNDDQIRCVTLKTLPESHSVIGMVRPLMELPFASVVVLTINICEQKKEFEKLHRQRRITHSFAAGSGAMSDLESESKLGHIEELIRELLEGSEKIVAASLAVLLKSPDAGKLKEESDAVLKAFRSVNQSEGIVETLATLDCYLANLPGMCIVFRPKKMKSSNASHLMPLYGYWPGSLRPVCILPNRSGELVAIDPFAASLPNWNGLIFGGSGAGKSFTILHLMLMFYGQVPRPKIVWIDNGASSERLLEVLDGEFIDLNIRSSIRINPFDLEPDTEKPTPQKIKLILAVLESILKENATSGLSKRSKALLEEVIFKAYAEKTPAVPTLSDLRRLLADHVNSELKAFADTLFSWTGDSAYGRMLDGATNIAMCKDLITVETKGLDDYPDLQNVFLLLFTDFIKSEASRDKTRPYLLILDEAWKLFQTPSGLQFAIEAYRTFRKFFGGIWCISQNYKDFLFNQEIKNAIFPNTTSVFVLKQRAIDWKDFAETLQLNASEVDAIKSLQIKKGEYSELFFMQEAGRAILRVEPDPLSYLICTSDPIDKTKIEETERANPNLSKLDVLQTLVRKPREEIHS